MKLLKPLNQFIQKFTTLPQKWLVIGGLAIIALFITLLATQPLANSIESINPSNQDTGIPIDSQITINFKQPIKPQDQTSVILTLQPQIAGQLIFNSGNTQAIFTPSEFFTGDTIYTVIITGKNLKEHQITFRTRPVADKNKLFPLPQAPGPLDTENPKQKLLQSLPYRTDEFLIQYTTVGDNIYITIYKEPIESHKQQALAWLRRFGFPDTETQLNVRYNIPKYLDTTWLEELP